MRTVRPHSYCNGHWYTRTVAHTEKSQLRSVNGLNLFLRSIKIPGKIFPVLLHHAASSPCLILELLILLHEAPTVS